MEKEVKDIMMSWFEDDESKFIFENKLACNENNDFIYMQKIVDRCLPELKSRLKHSEKENELIDLLKNKRHIWIWGGGACCTKIIREIIRKADIKVEGIIDRSTEKMEVLSTPVCTYDKVDFQNIDCLIISMLDGSAIRSCVDLAVSMGTDKDNIIVYQSYYGCNKIALSDRQYFEDFIQYGEGEVFVDAGVFDLCTSLRFAGECKKRHISNYEIYAFEPDVKSYERCIAIKEQNPKIDITLVNKGLWSSDTTLHFQTSGGSSAKVTEESSDHIEVVSLDSYIKEKVTFIKMDIEGAELEALKGCQNTIKKYRPKLAICVYHKKEDIIEIPRYIMSLVSDYHYYLRHYSSGFAETVLYALP